MRRFVLVVCFVALCAGAWWFFQNYHVLGLDQVRIVARQRSADDVGDDSHSVSLPAPRGGKTIRVASFNIQVFGETKLAKPRVREVLAEIVRQFDVVAIQEIRSKQDILGPFLDVVNASGRRYDCVVGPRLGRTSSKEQYAFVFDTASIEIDRSALYTITDTDDLLHREPLVGWFRVRGPPPAQAFTFSLVNIHTDPDETVQELDVLADVFRAVRNDGRGEDDVILLGDLNVDDHHLGRLGQVPQIHHAISGVATNTRGNKLYDNILFTDTATSEYTGRWAVFDMIREFNITTEEALEISDHMPIWAEFSAYEGGVGGGQTGPIATRPFNPAR